MTIPFVINKDSLLTGVEVVILLDIIFCLNLVVWQDYMEIVQQLPKPRFLDLFQRKYAHALTVGFAIDLKFVFGF
jgi:hypothetical protein